jgi:hypothetical protein
MSATENSQNSLKKYSQINLAEDYKLKNLNLISKWIRKIGNKELIELSLTMSSLVSEISWLSDMSWLEPEIKNSELEIWNSKL